MEGRNGVAIVEGEYPSALTEAGFRVNPSAGNWVNRPTELNNNNLGLNTGPNTNIVGHILTVVLPELLRIKELRTFGHPANTGGGTCSANYMDANGQWHVWVIGIPSRTTSTWSGWDDSGGEVFAQQIQLEMTVNDGSGWYRLEEMQVRG